MKVLRVFPDLTLLHVVLLRILEALLKVLFNLLEERILPMFQSPFDVVKGYRPLDLLVVIRILSLGR